MCEKKLKLWNIVDYKLYDVYDLDFDQIIVTM